MDSIIQWCNDNSGFLSAILSVVTIFISVIAILISINMARLPYKKKLKLNGTIGYLFGTDIETPQVAGFYVNVCNIGNRSVNIKYLGLALTKKEGGFKYLHIIDGSHSSGAPIMPTESFEVMYPAKNLLMSLHNVDRHRIIYYLVEDSEGGVKKKKYDTVGGLLRYFGL